MKLLLIILLSIACNSVFSKTFATFNLVVENNTANTFTTECYGSKGDDSVNLYYDSTWKHSQTKIKTLLPGEKATFHIGTYTHRSFVIPRIYSSSPYISDKSYFCLVLNKVSNDNTVQSNVKTIWQGGNGDFDPDEHNTRFYYYRYTGSFVFKSSTPSNNKTDFSLFGSSHFGSTDYSNEFILTSDELWDKEAGYYLVNIQPSDTKPVKKTVLYPPAEPNIPPVKPES
jgi:hypothetical protein